MYLFAHWNGLKRLAQVFVQPCKLRFCEEEFVACRRFFCSL
jgi:hypothetical protein